jgi:hypothetical protein
MDTGAPRKRGAPAVFLGPFPQEGIRYPVAFFVFAVSYCFCDPRSARMFQGVLTRERNSRRDALAGRLS